MFNVTKPPNLHKLKYDCPHLITLTRAYSHLYKPGSLPSVTKDLDKSTLHQDRMIKQINITYAEICSGNNITKEFTNNNTSLDFLNWLGNNIAFKLLQQYKFQIHC